MYNQLSADLINLYYASLLIIAKVEKVLHIELGGRDIFDAVHAYIILQFCFESLAFFASALFLSKQGCNQVFLSLNCNGVTLLLIT